MRLRFSNSSQLFTTLDLYEYILDSGHILAAYACINGNIKLYNVTCDLQNKIVSSIKFKALLDSKTNITEIIYDKHKKISAFLREVLKELKEKNNNKIPSEDTLQTNFINETRIARLIDDNKNLRLREEALIVEKEA
ncbi:hypothetical protein F8M41_008912 [Gigaspora margarita]|uniref:Uncharacterized protein n=1 Tax=Gigaspora margarita TaxID=4874 RepID=A0A8H3X3L3_GIGMA|nr:hypothetical protein F8M41_008912 [Gigaspora margarita]